MQALDTIVGRPPIPAARNPSPTYACRISGAGEATALDADLTILIAAYRVASSPEPGCTLARLLRRSAIWSVSSEREIIQKLRVINKCNPSLLRFETARWKIWRTCLEAVILAVFFSSRSSTSLDEQGPSPPRICQTLNNIRAFHTLALAPAAAVKKKEFV